ncbi:hypothetical protein GIB67_017092 [Kingdonia uniflora]|uniref:Disease resistance R13L4/SHOC-2-like LRR domain-containing protein n=1 Tax=Kingdonia uniflora TaxID=39325 RepID=A0A7J7NCA2_9MAGN|nr:hypothetical protein GIB67_017092 [Kingdonia uniflora]
MGNFNDRLTILETKVSTLTSTVGELVEELRLTNLAKAATSVKRRDRSKKKGVMEVNGDKDVPFFNDSSAAKSDEERSVIGKSTNSMRNPRINFKIDIPIFDGSIDAEMLDNWFDRLEAYFSVYKYYNAQQICFATLKFFEQSVQEYTTTFHNQALVLDIDVDEYEVFMKYTGGLSESIRRELKLFTMANIKDATVKCKKGVDNKKAYWLSRPPLPTTSAMLDYMQRQPFVTSRYDDPIGRSVFRQKLQHGKACEVLSLLSSTIIILPPEVEKLIHLRYLNLSGNGLIELPETITNLFNLETLMLNDCRRLCELPQGMGKLVNLRHLGIECTDKLEFLPRGIGRMRSLRTLSKFIVGGGCKIEELKNLNLLQRKLEIKRLERVTNKDEAMQAELKNKQYLRDLRLFFEWNDSLETNEVDRIEGVLEGLEPQANLNELTIRSYIGCKFPRWMMSGTVMSNLCILIVDQCNCVQLPFLETLERLEIWRMPKVKRIESEFLGIDSSDGVERSFPKLEILRFDTMDNLEEWDLNMKDIMPRLKHLTVRNCPKLKRIPAIGNLEVLETLEINGISSFEYVSGELWGLSNREDGGESAPAVVFPKLKKLQFKYMDKWEEWEIMTRNEITIMPCLLELDFFNCSKLKSVPECIMSSGTIRDLTITNCPFLMWTQSCLPPLLERLSLTNDAGDLLKEIPACSTLKRLDIAMAECVSLPQGLAHLKSLQRLFIFECKKVKCIPQELQHLTSLQELEIIDCDILGPRCQKEVGEDWNIISHIPNIQVDAHLLLI